jgi:hypothetical protein
MVWPGQSAADALCKLGVRRLSAGSAIAQILWAHAEVLAREFLTTGDSASLNKASKPYPELQALFANR